MFRLVCMAVIFLGVIIHLPCCGALSGVAIPALKDYERQRREGKNPQFKAANIHLAEDQVEFWK